MRRIQTLLLKSNVMSIGKKGIFSVYLIPSRWFSSDNHCCDDPNHHHHHQNERKNNLNIISGFNDDNFNEKTVFPYLINLTQQQWSQKNEENLVNIYELILRNLKKVSIPESIVMFIDKSRYLPKKFLKIQHKRDLLDRAIEILDNSYFCKSDQGDRLRSITLVLTLGKWEFSHPLYVKILEKGHKEIDDIDTNSLVSILEGFSFNKLCMKTEASQKFMASAFTKLEELTIRDLRVYPRVIELLTYRVKSFPDMKEGETLNKIIKKLSNNLLTFAINDKNLKNHVLKMTEYVNTFQIYINASGGQNTELKFLCKQLAEKVELFFSKNDLKKLSFPYSSILEFQSHFYNTKIEYLPKQLLLSFTTNLKLFPFDNLKNLSIYLSFILKNREGFEIPVEINKKILAFLQKEKGITTMTKLLDIYGFAKPINDKSMENYGLQEEILNLLEEKAMRTCKRMNYPPNHFLSLFQYLNYLGRGKQDNWLIFLEHFSKESNLAEVEIFSLLIRLIPTVANKAKNEFKTLTNVSMNMTPVSGYLRNFKEKTKLVLVLEKFWGVLETHLLPLLPKIYPDKYPTLLLHLVYANLTYRKFLKIHEVLQKPILSNLSLYSEKQIAGVLYSYARVMLPVDISEFFLQVSEHLKEIIQTKPQNFKDYEIANIMWAFSIARVYDRKLIGFLEMNALKQIKTFKNESLSEFVRAMANFSLRTKENENLLKDINSMLVEKMKIKQEKIEFGHLLLWAHSFIILENFDRTCWKLMLGYFQNNKNLIRQDDFHHYYLYLIYLHLIINPRTRIDFEFELENLRNILVSDKLAILNHLIVNKKKSISKNEEKVIEIIRNREVDIFGQAAGQSSPKASFLEISKNGMTFIFFDDLNDLQKSDFSQEFLEKTLIIPFATDFRRGNTLIEHNGKIHFFLDADTKEFVMNGVTKAKKTALEQLGFRYVEIPFNVGEEEEKVVKYIKEKINK